MSTELKPVALTEEEKTEILDWVSACQSAYHIDSTPGHRFGGLGSNLDENRAGLIEFVESIVESRAPAAAPQHSADIDAMRLDAERYLKWVSYSGYTKQQADATLDAIQINEHAAIDAALQAKGVAE
ncbi:hypothetical protein BGLT_02198 [Caballeronia glathei]|uniref:Uncharacterized protein n=1 Tax=Caballeronia glathei TaxID=60547 RepID=A0A069PQB6_9BURK|nr:hypothetical protein [Caballeronia glathei]KDR39501.1 hypothetical protein BG61_31970 [Caballeronia glathei]CDY79417.1 hypothetical protein BGLT_02198 [Caballeronia glathei]